jgi:hypothetical protein
MDKGNDTAAQKRTWLMKRLLAQFIEPTCEQERYRHLR